MDSIEITGDSSAFSLSSRRERFEYDGSDLEAMSSAVNYPRWIVDEFRPYLYGNIADVGAGSGNFSKYLLEADVETIHAFEPSARMYELLQARYRDECRLEPVNSYVSDVFHQFRERFDAVVYNNVMEHVEDDEAELKAAYEMLKPGGCALIYVPAMNWLYSDFDRSVGHFRRYEKAYGADVMLRAGFVIEQIKYTDLLGVLPWFLSMKVFKSRLSKKSVGLYDKIGVPATRFFEKLVRAPMGKNLLIVGRKQWLN